MNDSLDDTLAVPSRSATNVAIAGLPPCPVTRRSREAGLDVGSVHRSIAPPVIRTTTSWPIRAEKCRPVSFAVISSGGGDVAPATTTFNVHRSMNWGHASPGAQIGEPDALSVAVPGAFALTVADRPPLGPATTLEMVTTNDELCGPLQRRVERRATWNESPTDVVTTQGVPSLTETPLAAVTPHESGALVDEAGDDARAIDATPLDISDPTSATLRSLVSVERIVE